jgi:alpha-L-fucosidase
MKGVHGGFYTAEYSAQYWTDRKWEENSGILFDKIYLFLGIDIFSYGLNRMTTADSYLTVNYLIGLLVRTVSFGGNLLLDVGPASDGTIPVVMQE